MAACRVIAAAQVTSRAKQDRLLWTGGTCAHTCPSLSLSGSVKQGRVGKGNGNGTGRIRVWLVTEGATIIQWEMSANATLHVANKHILQTEDQREQKRKEQGWGDMGMSVPAAAFSPLFASGDHVKMAVSPVFLLVHFCRSSALCSYMRR